MTGPSTPLSAGRSAAVVLAVLSIAASAQNTPRPRSAPGAGPMSVDDLMRLRAIVDAHISPDGERVAYVVSTPSLSRNEHETALFVVRAAGGPPARLGEAIRIFNVPVPAPRLRWSPDGTVITVLAMTRPQPQVFAVPVDGSEPRQLTRAASGVFAYEWSPDGKSLAFLTRDSVPDEETRRRSDGSFVIRPDAPSPATRLAIQNLATGTLRLISPASQYVDSFSWSPDGAEIAYAAASRSGFMGPYFTRIYAVRSDGEALRPIVDRPGMNLGPKYSPDGRAIAFTTTSGRTEIMAPRSLAVVAARGVAPPRVFPMDDAWVNEYEWAADGAAIYLQANDGTFGRGEHMFEQALVRLAIADGRAERIDGGPAANFSVSVSRDGRRLACRRVEARSMGDLVVIDTATRKTTTVTDVNPELRSFAVGDMRPIKWRSGDGMEIWGLLLTPAPSPSRRSDAVAKVEAKLPLLVYIHGGPGGGVTYGLFPQFMHIVPQVDPYPTAAMAGAGFAVLFPMPRGGAGYGEAGQRMIVNAWGEGDYADIMAGVDALVNDGTVDPDRIGVMGASYGGYMTNWIVTQTRRFKAASAGASISDLNDLYLLSEGGEFIVEYFRRPWENRDSFVSHSPITFADRMTTPLLIQHGENDPRVPLAGALKFYRTLKAMGKPVELEIYPRGGHVLREPMQQREQMQRNFEWFLRWIK